MNLLSPSAWNDVSAVAIALFVVAAFIFALVRGWLVLGRHHTELMRSKDEALENERGVRVECQKTIEIQANTIYEQRVSGDVSRHLLEAIREAAGQPAQGSEVS